MRRRAVLSAVALALGPAPGARAAGREDVLAALADLPAARALGRHALLAMPGMDAGTMAALLADDLAGTGTLRQRVETAARRDFAAGRMARVDGWMLAAVEARLCALAALRAGFSPGSAPR